jgi:hypothetical protein
MRKIIATHWRAVADSILALIVASAIVAGIIAWVSHAQARDKGQWDLVGHDELTRQWFRGLVQPDTIGRGGLGGTVGISCCGESDAYYADVVRVRAGKTYAVITDERDDGPLERAHEDIGTEYEVPPSKIVGQEQYLKGNPTGHIVIFLGGVTHDGDPNHRLQPRSVLCYVPNGGF